MRNEIFFASSNLASNFGTSSFPPIFWIPFFGKTFIPAADSTFVQMQAASRLAFCQSFFKTAIGIFARLVYSLIRPSEIQ